MKVHYLRVSTKEQNLERQFSDSGNEVMTGYQRFKEHGVSGRIPFRERPKAQELIEFIESGEVTELYVHSLDRLGRDSADLLSVVKYLYEKNVNLVTKQEGLRTLNEDGTPNPMAQLMIGIMSTLAEWDWNRRRQNQQEGIDIAKAKGMYRGRAEGSGMSDADYLKKHKKVVQFLMDKLSLRHTAKLSDVSLSTAQRVKRILQEQGKIK
jgi:DNA invertase Pin-like site-specific DNA recombinase